MILFGGVGPDFQPLHDIWKYTLSTDKWQQLTSDFLPLSNLTKYSTIFVPYNDQFNIYVFGGMSLTSTTGSRKFYKYYSSNHHHSFLTL